MIPKLNGSATPTPARAAAKDATARWLTAAEMAQRFAVDTAALHRYAMRGMIGAKWDEQSGWRYDARRAAELWLSRDTAVSYPMRSFGRLGEVVLGR